MKGYKHPGILLVVVGTRVSTTKSRISAVIEDERSTTLRAGCRHGIHMTHVIGGPHPGAGEPDPDSGPSPRGG